LTALMSLVDYVLIDSAPILLVADAVGLASRVDGVIIVSRAGSATVDQAHEIRTTLERVGARLVGLVITGVKVKSRHGYRSGYYQRSS
jgi:Mrp family chromosome partitioning ATPase